MAVWKVEICLEKKNLPRAQIFRYFRFESRNNMSVFVHNFAGQIILIDPFTTDFHPKY